MMRCSKKIILPVLCLMLIPIAAHAGDFDGSRPLLCATIRIVECFENGGCSEVIPEEVGMPRFFTIDFTNNTIRPTPESGIDRISRIERLAHIDGKLILQGAEDGVEDVRDGLGWTLAISEETGRLVLTASGEGVAFVVYGACTVRQ